jgi:hypothetical protein
LSAKNAGQTGLNRTTQAVSSISTWYGFAGQVSGRRTLPHFGRVFGAHANCVIIAASEGGIAALSLNTALLSEGNG